VRPSTLRPIHRAHTSGCRDVRRAALLNVPATLATLPAILARTRDVESVIRRLVYSAVLLPQATMPSPGTVRGVAHPRALSIAQRELVVRAGLGDRAPDVRKAVARLLGAWVDVAADVAPGTDGSGDAAADGDADVVDVQRDVLAFLRMFDLGAATIAEDALLCVFASRPELLDGLNFDGTVLFRCPQAPGTEQSSRGVLGASA
jgi:condensin complex subunit 3